MSQATIVRVFVALVLAVVIGVAFNGENRTHASSFTVPPLSKITASIPETLFAPETHLVCLVRAEPSGSSVPSRSLCYQSEKPAAAPPPPPPPYQQGVEHDKTTGTLNQSTGVLTIPYIPCQEYVPGVLAVGTNLVIQITKSAGPYLGSVELTIDTTSPFNCVGETPTTGPLVATALSMSNDEDGDTCADWDELAPGPINLDPFNPNDCPIVGGLADVPNILGPAPSSGASWMFYFAFVGTLCLLTLVAVILFIRRSKGGQSHNSI